MNKQITYFWRKVGTLKIRFQGNHAVTLRFTPSKEAIKKGLARADRRHKGENYKGIT